MGNLEKRQWGELKEVTKMFARVVWMVSVKWLDVGIARPWSEPTSQFCNLQSHQSLLSVLISPLFLSLAPSSPGLLFESKAERDLIQVVMTLRSSVVPGHDQFSSARNRWELLCSINVCAAEYFCWKAAKRLSILGRNEAIRHGTRLPDVGIFHSGPFFADRRGYSSHTSLVFLKPILPSPAKPH